MLSQLKLQKKKPLIWNKESLDDYKIEVEAWEKQLFGIIGFSSTEGLIGNVNHNHIHSDNFNKQVITSEISLWHFLDHFKIQITWRQQWWMELWLTPWEILYSRLIYQDPVFDAS